MTYYLVTLKNNNGFDITDVEVFLFSNKNEAEAHSIKLIEQRRGSKSNIEILHIELDKDLNYPGCSGEIIFIK
jgi:hypothetical protein